MKIKKINFLEQIHKTDFQEHKIKIKNKEKI